jgi:phage tail-like protein
MTTQAGPSIVGYYPPVNFHFRAEFLGFNKATDVFFQSISGLDVNIEMETKREGGENRFVHHLPKQVQYTDLVLKRGIFRPGESSITDWFSKAIQEFRFSPMDILVTLLDPEHQPLMTWGVVHALPKSWKVQELNAERGEVLIETMTLTYNYFTFQKG